jgi:hypothetical protein
MIMKHHNEKKETIYDEEQEMVNRGFGTRRDPVHLRHLGYQHWANEKHSHTSKDLMNMYDSIHKSLMGYNKPRR